MAVVHVVIRGRVQGVGYRAFVERRAEVHGLAGWVRNRVDGGVEAVFSGEAGEVAAMVEDCRRGPRLARVAAVDAVEAADEGWRDFAVRATT